MTSTWVHVSVLQIIASFLRSRDNRNLADEPRQVDRVQAVLSLAYFFLLCMHVFNSKLYSQQHVKYSQC